MPEQVTTAWWKEERGERIFVDFNQANRDRTMAGAYSPRALPRAPVSTPVAWDELDRRRPRDFTVRTVPAAVADERRPVGAACRRGRRHRRAARVVGARPRGRARRAALPAGLPEDAGRAAAGAARRRSATRTRLPPRRGRVPARQPGGASRRVGLTAAEATVTDPSHHPDERVELTDDQVEFLNSVFDLVRAATRRPWPPTSTAAYPSTSPTPTATPCCSSPPTTSIPTGPGPARTRRRPEPGQRSWPDRVRGRSVPAEPRDRRGPPRGRRRPGARVARRPSDGGLLPAAGHGLAAQPVVSTSARS